MSAALSPSGLALRLGLFYAGYFLFLGLFVPYWPVWLKAHGLTAGQIGLLIALTQILKASAAPMIAQLSDASGRRRDYLLAASVLTFVSFALFAFTDGFAGILMVTALSHLFLPALLPLNEQMTMAAVRRHGLHYGRIRSLGSVTFIAGSLIGGAAIARYGAGAVFWVIAAALMVPVAAAYLLPRDPMRGGRRAPLSLHPVLQLLRRRDLVFLLGVVSLLQGSHGVYYVIGTIHWQAAGLDARAIGALWAISVVAEILLFVFCGNWVGRQSSRLVFAVVAVAGAVRWTGTGLTASFAPLLVLQCLHGVTYGATHLATLAYLSRRVPEEGAATAQALYTAIPMGLATGVTLALSGVLYDHFGAMSYFAMTAMSLVALVILVLIPPPRPERG